MNEIRAFAAARGIQPTTVLQVAVGLSGTTWKKWEAGAASCSLRTAERLRHYMQQAEPVSTPEEDAA